MKTLPISTILILPLGTISLASLPAIANQKQAIVVVRPDSRLSCDEAIANVKEDLTQRNANLITCNSDVTLNGALRCR